MKLEIIKYQIPEHWIKYDILEIIQERIEAEIEIKSLQKIPYQKDWVESLQKMEWKREVAGTSRIEGADFTERELDIALSESPEQLMTRSQRQAHAASQTYRWIATLPHDLPVTGDLIREIHRRIITGADDDHCEPGRLRGQDQDVTFGQPRHRGAEGGEECEAAFNRFVEAVNREYKKHPPILQALAVHYHFATIHPFQDGNGRTARALEALMLQRAGLHNTCFIAMSNYYYEEKSAYLNALSDVRGNNFNLNSFFKFALKGIISQTRRVGAEIQNHAAKAIFRNIMFELFGNLKSERKRVIGQRQMEILKILLDVNHAEIIELYKLIETTYKTLKSPFKAYIRDLLSLEKLKAINIHKDSQNKMDISINLDWPKQINKSDFMQKMKILPRPKTFHF
ncbi:MAG: Fic family protein [Candidatus Sumerlaeota bacterium]|nr:Fic family protein [Candidatus Sumerlaeota bacterium]